MLTVTKRGNKCQTTFYKDASNPHSHKWVVECSCGTVETFTSPQEAFNYQHSHVEGK